MNARTLIFNLLLFACPCWLLAQEQGADFTASQRRACSPAIVEFSSTASEAVAWQWDFGNGNTSALPNPGTTYQQAGTYDVRLTLTYADGRQEHLLKEAFITILAAPQAAFSASSVQVCAEEELLFEDESLPGSGALIQWIWDFGDGIVDSSGASLPHTYLAGGSFPVTLIVKDENGCSDLLLKEDYLQVQPLPDAGFDVDNNLSCTLPLRVQFTSANQGGSHLWDFGDLSSSNQPNPAHTYTQGGSFSVTHTITDSMGCRQSMVRTNLITANQNQIPLQLSDTVACPGQVLSGFCGAGNFTGIRWRFGNGFESQECEPLFSYSQPGTYQVELSLSGADGCSYTASRSVRVSSPPEVSFTVDDSLLCAPPFTVHFSGQSNQDVSWHWQFGDAGTATGPSPVFTFPFSDTPESYDIGLLVTNADGCSKALGKPELIRTFQTVPRIGFSLREGCAPLEVAFQDSTQTPFEITSWHWDFGDGSTSSLQAPTHTYTDTGYYDVSLAISTEAGCNDTLRWPGLIKAGRPPVADFTIDTNHVCAEMPISFTNLSQYADSAFWQFGDGDTAMSFHPRHVYGDVGWMSVNLTVFNKGCADTLLVEDMIYIDPPVAMFEPGQCYSCKSPATFQFTDLSLGAHRWLWRFGDGDSSTERHPEHTYEAPGFYQISLRVENDSTGCAYEAFGTALVDPPEIRASTNVSGGCAPLEVQFSDHSPEAIKWIWDFGDGDSATTPNASHIYTQPGRYEASLTIVTILDIVGGDTITCTAEQLHYIEVFDPQVDFSVSDQSGCVPFTPQFFDQSVSRAPIASYNWNFDNLGTSNEPNPTFTFTNPGAYSISLAITDTTGCVSATTKFDYVLTSSARPDFVADFPVNCPLNPIQFENRSQGNELSYFWDFGDGATSTLANPTHAYQSPDFYTVELSVSDGICDTSMLLDRYIHIEEPLISLGADLTQADCPPLAVNFTGEILSVHGFNQWVWDLGDGSSSVQRNPSNIYAYAGKYDIGLIATAPSGCADTLSLPNYIQIGGPSASFYFEPGAACPGEPVVFVASGTNVQQYKWDLGDGAILTGPDLSQLTHTYEQAGSYQPVLAIRDADACEVLIPSPDSVRVFPAPRAEFGADTLRFCQEGEVVFTDLSTSESPIASWRWEFGDGSISEEQHPTHFYSSPGNMDVQLTVTTVDGCTSQLMRSAWVEVLADVPPEMPGIQYASV
ncbi:MAG: PKD domain-containing protein, partial [Bacteroidetes bacterium]